MINWRKSSFSANGDSCVEVSWPVTGAAVRDSKNTEGPTLEFPLMGWQEFVANLQR